MSAGHELKHALARGLDVAARPAEALLAAAMSRRIAGTRVERPVILFGAERSGTTLLYGILANHSHTCWLSRLDDALPGCPVLSALCRRAVGASGPRRPVYRAIRGGLGRARGRFPPAEGVAYWRRVLGFGDESDYGVEDDVLTERDATPVLKARLQRDARKRLAAAARPRLLLKQPGFSLKLRFLDVVFPDARLIHCVRHPDDNHRSLVEAKRRRPGEHFWGTKIPGWREHLDAAPELQAALQLQAALEHTEADLDRIAAGGRSLRVRYEDLLRSPREVVGKVLEFCGFPPEEGVESALAYVERRESSESRAAANAAPRVREILDELRIRTGYEA